MINTIILIVLVLLSNLVFSQNVQALEKIKNKIVLNDIGLKKNELRLFKNKLLNSEKIELEKKYGFDFLEHITFKTIVIEMTLPKKTKIDTLDFYENFKYFNISKRNGLNQTIILCKNEIIGATIKYPFSNKYDLDLILRWDNEKDKIKMRQELKLTFDFINKQGYLVLFHVMNTGLGTMLLTNDGIFTISNNKETHNLYTDRYIKLEESLNERKIIDWKVLFWVKK